VPNLQRLKWKQNFILAPGFDEIAKWKQYDVQTPVKFWLIPPADGGRRYFEEETQMRSVRYLAVFTLAIITFLVPTKSSAQIGVGISVHIGPPALPVYVQPPCPAAGYLWTPGYWAYGDDGYYWVPGTWVMAPEPGFLWTPGYWGWGGGLYAWHGGYWGSHIGFYGGVNYGFGYGGVGFEGGRWDHGVFAYNRSVTNVNTTVINNTYNKTVINNNTTVNRTSFNGGTGGTTAQPTAAERSAESEHHVQPTSAQMDHQHQASTNRAQLASVNGGKPAVAASPKPGVFSGKGVVQAKAAGGPAGNANHPAANTAKTDRPPSGAAKSNTATTSKSSTNNASNRPANSTSNKTANGSSNSNRPASANKAVSADRPNTANRPSSAPHPSTANKPVSNPHPNTEHAQGGNRPPANHPTQPQPQPRPQQQPQHEKAPRPEGKPGR
jgi:WXXGXW repeat (2 copies)